MLKHEQVELILEALRQGAALGRNWYGRVQSKTTKNDGSLVTEIDKEIEHGIWSAVQTGLRALFVGEETSSVCLPGESERFAESVFASEYAWVVDPLDGTNNFAAGYGEWAISVALLKRAAPGKIWPVFAAVALPMTGQVFVAEAARGLKRYMFGHDGRQYHVLPPDKSLLVPNGAKRDRLFLAVNDSKVDKYRFDKTCLRIMGSTVSQMMAVATGLIHGAIVAEHIWDIAGALFVGEVNGCRLYRLDDGEEVKCLTQEMFSFADAKRAWKLKKDYLFCLPEYRSALLERIAKRPVLGT